MGEQREEAGLGWVEGDGTTWKREAEPRALRALYDGLKAVDFIWEAIGSLCLKVFTEMNKMS